MTLFYKMTHTLFGKSWEFGILYSGKQLAISGIIITHNCHNATTEKLQSHHQDKKEKKKEEGKKQKVEKLSVGRNKQERNCHCFIHTGNTAKVIVEQVLDFSASSWSSDFLVFSLISFRDVFCVQLTSLIFNLAVIVNFLVVC